MAQTHLSLSWHHYHNNLRAGFSLSQQNGDFVDLTLAADGHLVKVHQLILGIASPYIKSLIQSASCKHPIIFLNNISYGTLSSLLEYVYTGEVVIAEENLDLFLNAAKALRIQGLDDMDNTLDSINDPIDKIDKTNNFKDDLQGIQIQILNNETVSNSAESLPSTSKSDLSSQGLGLGFKRKSVEKLNFESLGHSLSKSMKPSDDIMKIIEDVIEIPDDPQKKDGNSIWSSLPNLELTPVSDLTADNYISQNTQELQYTVSNRGSLQLILNRYIYNIFSRSNGGHVRRWRCVDYRDHKCPACAITNGNFVIKRTNMHNHPFHDKKILAKLEKKAIYSAIKPGDANKND